MLSSEKVIKKPGVFLSLTSLSPKEFYKLVPEFEKALLDCFQKKTLEGKERRRSFGGGRKSKTLSSPAQKLFFLLVYFKLYPLQEVMGLLFGLGQSHVCEEIQRLTPVLEKALGLSLHLPERSPASLEQVLRRCPALEFVLDGTERRRTRPLDKEAQKANYSGKKKTHTKKNLLIVDKHSKLVMYLSRTSEGKKHDKAICDEEQYKFPQGSKLWLDTGFQGYELWGGKTFHPKKKPKGKELTEEEKEKNRLISSERICVEHVISGVKRCRIVKDVLRSRKRGFEDQVMSVACGLHNFRVEHRKKKAA
jgi:hypothetical protein